MTSPPPSREVHDLPEEDRVEPELPTLPPGKDVKRQTISLHKKQANSKKIVCACMEVYVATTNSKEFSPKPLVLYIYMGHLQEKGQKQHTTLRDISYFTSSRPIWYGSRGPLVVTIVGPPPKQDVECMVIYIICFTDARSEVDWRQC